MFALSKAQAVRIFGSANPGLSNIGWGEHSVPNVEDMRGAPLGFAVPTPTYTANRHHKVQSNSSDNPI